MSKLRWILPWGLLAAGLLAAPLGRAGEGPAAWVLDTLTKVRSDWAPTGTEATSAALFAAGNEVAAFQVALVGGTDGLSGVSAAMGPLADALGHTLPASGVALFRESYLTITHASDGAGGTGSYPDGLIPAVDEFVGEARTAFPMDIAPGEAAAIWVDVRIPVGSLSAVYSGTLTLSGGLSAAIPVEVTVYPFDLPATSSLRSAFLAFTPAICALELGSADACSSPAGEALLARYLQLALDHRVSLANVAPVAPAAGLAGFDESIAPFVEGSAPTQLVGAKLTSLEFGLSPDPSAYASWLSELTAKGWSNLTFVYAADEPGVGASSWAQAKAAVAEVEASAPGLPSLVTTTVQAAQANETLPNILAPVVNELDDVSGPYAGNQRPAYDHFLQGGGALWTYQSCMSHGCAFGGDPSQSGWPSYMIDASPGRNRAMQWVDFALAVSGELYYETALAYEGGDPWADQYRFGGNGDGTLFYPGEPAKIGGATEIPVASLRLKLIRQGMEDYEYLKKVKDLGDPAFALLQAASVAPTPHSVASDPAVFHEARAALGARILELLGAALPAVAPPGDAGSPSSTPTPGGATQASGGGGTTDAGDPQGALATAQAQANLRAFSRCAGATDDPRCAGATGTPGDAAPTTGPKATLDATVHGTGCQTGAGPLSAWLVALALSLFEASRRRRRSLKTRS